MKTILIAEDNQMLLRYYELALSPYFTLLTACSVNSALGTLSHDIDNTIDAVVSDYDLGDGTGADVYRWIKDHRPELPFFLCTGNRGVALDAVIFHKPFDLQDLRKAIETRL